MPRGKTFQAREKQMAVEAILGGARQKDVAEQFGATTRALRNWVAAYQRGDLVVAVEDEAAGSERRQKRMESIIANNLTLLEEAVAKARELLPGSDNLQHVVKTMEVAWLRHMDMTQGRPGMKGNTILNDNRTLTLNEELLAALRERPLAEIIMAAPAGPAAGVEPPVGEVEDE